MYRKIKKATGVLMPAREKVFTIRRQLRANQDILDNVPFWVNSRYDMLRVGPYAATPEKINKLKTELEKYGYECTIHRNVIIIKE